MVLLHSLGDEGPRLPLHVHFGESSLLKPLGQCLGRKARLVGLPASTHFSFMGHIDGPHISDLIDNRAPEVAASLVSAGVEGVLLTPG